MNVEEQLRDALRNSGKPPKQIGEEAGVDFGAIYKFLAGKAELRSGTFAKLCQWAGLSLYGQGQSAEPAKSLTDMEIEYRATEKARRWLIEGFDNALRERAEKDFGRDRGDR